MEYFHELILFKNDYDQQYANENESNTIQCFANKKRIFGSFSRWKK